LWQDKENRISRIAYGGRIGCAGRINFACLHVPWVKNKKRMASPIKAFARAKPFLFLFFTEEIASVR